MKKKKQKRTTHVFKRIFNVRQWLDWTRIKGGGQFLLNSLKRLFVPQPERPGESFEVVMSRLHLSEKDIETRRKSLLHLSYLMVFLALIIFSYSIYHLFLLNFLAFFLSLIIMSIALVLAFRYHFWSFQIKQRKLGCTFKEWYRQGLMGHK